MNGSTAWATTAARARLRSTSPARIIAAADCYGAMREARPHRPALEASAAQAELLKEAKQVGSDADAVDAARSHLQATACGNDLASSRPG